MTTETRAIAVTACRTPDGKPTCCARWPEQRCRFLQTRSFGAIECCGAIPADLHRDGGDGYLIPAAGCPVWSDAP